MDNTLYENITDAIEVSKTHITRFNMITNKNMNTFVELVNALNKYADDTNVVISYKNTANFSIDLLDNMRDIINDCIIKNDLLIQLINEIDK